MAQNEDTELRDLVMEALEKNGSLAKIRALLRANVFLAFEDECEKLKHNISLDNILKVPEGVLALSLVHEFMEFCNLKNTLFVYMSETRQGREYSYEGQKKLSEKFHGLKQDQMKEPLLVTILKNVSKLFPRAAYGPNDNTTLNKDDQNCTYIVHEDSCSHSSSNQSNSHSDQSSDEKKKLHLRLPLDNSDTDTSSDSMRDKTSSEYIANEHIVINDESEDENKNNISQNSPHNDNISENKKFNINNNFKKYSLSQQNQTEYQPKLNDSEFVANISSQSTSYIGIKSFTKFTEINTSDVPPSKTDPNVKDTLPAQNLNTSIHASVSPATLSEVESISSKHGHNLNTKQLLDETYITSNNTPEYSYDFSPSPSSNNNQTNNEKNTDVTNQDQISTKDLILESPRQTSQSSQSSVSISDVADLIELSEANSPRLQRSENGSRQNDVLKSKLKDDNKLKSQSDDSVDFSVSPVPSLSNLSLDFHSD